MRKTLALFSVIALLSVLLVGCGQKTNNSMGSNSGIGTTQNGSAGSTTDPTDSTKSTGDTGKTGGTNSTTNGGGMGKSVTGSAIGGSGGNAASRWGSMGANNKTADDSRNTNATANAQLRGNSRSATGTISTPGTVLSGDEQYRRMLANAHVHDTDGFLLDGENSQYVTW